MRGRYLYEPGELEGQQYGGERTRRSTDLIWSVDVYKIKDRYIKEYQPTLHYLDGDPKSRVLNDLLNDLLFSKSFHPFKIPSYLISYLI